MLSPKFLKRAYDRLLRQDELDRDPPSPQAEQMAEDIQRAKTVETDLKNQVPPGYVCWVSEPEYIGKLPVTSAGSLALNFPIAPRVGPSEGEKEFAEHGSIALRIPIGIGSVAVDNTIDRTWTLTKGGTVLVRGKAGGFWMVSLRGSTKRGWSVTCGNTRVPVTFCWVRERWVVKELV
jgi:hypothetical protein